MCSRVATFRECTGFTQSFYWPMTNIQHLCRGTSKKGNSRIYSLCYIFRVHTVLTQADTPVKFSGSSHKWLITIIHWIYLSKKNVRSTRIRLREITLMMCSPLTVWPSRFTHTFCVLDGTSNLEVRVPKTLFHCPISTGPVSTEYPFRTFLQLTVLVKV